MSRGWSSSSRRSRLPSDWTQRRKARLRMDDRKCQWILEAEGRQRCLEPATDVDHVKPGDDHSIANLQSLCDTHHKGKSSAEGNAALWKKRREVNARFRRTEEHPGLL